MTVLRLSARASARLFAIVLRHTARPPDVVIGDPAAPYLKRWHVIPRNPLFNVYLHEFLRSDDDRALHDHPWVNCSILLHGEYDEHVIAKGGIHRRKRRKTGDVVLRFPRAAHRIELIGGRLASTNSEDFSPEGRQEKSEGREASARSEDFLPEGRQEKSEGREASAVSKRIVREAKKAIRARREVAG